MIGSLVLGALLSVGLATVSGVVLSWRSLAAWQRPRRAPLDRTPADFELAYEPVSFVADDGVRLEGWWLPAPAGTPCPAPAVVLCHGINNSRSQVVPMAAFLHRYGFASLVFDWRAHGTSGGERLSFGLRERGDLAAALSHVISRPEVDRERVGVLGFSLGAALAILGLADDPRVRALVVDSPFACLRRLMRENFRAFTRLPSIPFLLLAQPFLGRVLGFDPDRLRPLDALRRCSSRVLLIHGADDEFIPVGHSLALAAVPAHSELWVVKGSRHGEAFFKYPEAYAQRVSAFFRSYL